MNADERLRTASRNIEPYLKALAVRLSQEDGIDLDASYFYTDSYSDLPMLERVGHPRVINPDPRLKHYASSHDMPWEDWHPQGIIQHASGMQGRV